MTVGQKVSLPEARLVLTSPRVPLLGLYLLLAATGSTFLAALTLHDGFPLAALGDTLQLSLEVAAAYLMFQNGLRSRSQVRAFWFLLFLGTLMWLASQIIWCIYELWLRVPVPDSPLVDTFLFVKLVPLVVAAAVQPGKPHDPRFRTFGLLDLSILLLASLYLFAYHVYAYRLLPSAVEIYNFHFDAAHAIGNQIFVVVTGGALLRASGTWRVLMRLFFLAAAFYAFGSNFSNAAIDTGQYYTGSLYDLPLVASVSAFLWLALAGRSLPQSADANESSDSGESPGQFTFGSAHFAMLVAISIPAIGLWLTAAEPDSGILFFFRLRLTLVTIFFLTLLLSIKQDILSANLLGSLQHLSNMYASIDRFKDHLLQSEKLTALGELVASASRQIAVAMTQIQEQAHAVTSRSAAGARSGVLAAKIGQYALRTDALAESMQRFAQETPLQLAPVEVKPLLESALHLSRIGKLAHLRVELHEEGSAPPVLADSSQLLHVFLQILSNAVDALQEVGGGELLISIRPCEPHVCIQFADTGPGIKHPEHVFEPFFTTKPVGKGTGLGLSTCYGIIRQHNGDISCGNRVEGGAHFTIFLPAAPAAVSVSSESSPVAVEGAG